MTTTTSSAGAPPTPRPIRSPRLGLFLLALPSLLIAIDITGLSVALPRMAADLRPTPTELLWMNDIYGFMVGGAMITMGTVGDRIGRRRLIVICAVVFALASAVAAFSVAPWMIIATRAVMGVAGAAIMPASMALIRQLFPEPKQAVSALGAYMTCFLGGMAVAPLVGGLLVEVWGWGAVFLLGVPVMLITVIGAPRLLPEFADSKAGRIDLPSAALCVLSVLMVVYSLKAFVNSGWSVLAAATATVGVLLGLAFVRRQRRLEQPLLDLTLLLRGGAGRTAAVLFLTALVMGGSSLFVAFYLQSVQGLSPFGAALWQLPQMISMVVASNLGPALGRRFAPDRVVLISLVLMTVGFVLFSLVPTGWPGLVLLALATMLATGGVGSAFPYLMNEIVAPAPVERAGSAAALAQSFNELGIATGLVVLGSIGTLAYRARLHGTDDLADSWVDGFADATHDPASLDQVGSAFLSGFHAAGLASVLIMAAVLLLRVVPRRSPVPANASTLSSGSQR